MHWRHLESGALGVCLAHAANELRRGQVCSAEAPQHACIWGCGLQQMASNTSRLIIQDGLGPHSIVCCTPTCNSSSCCMSSLQR